ncbi:MAG: beta-galactosidase [Kiritimatiellae bacterium]|nr:beta-galactosidase [Kiritimatiellia bacterium]
MNTDYSSLMAPLALGFALAAQQAMSASLPADMAREIDTRLRIGSHLYLRRDMSEADIFAAIEKMSEIGMDIVRVYPYWADVETAPGEYDFTQVDACYRACEKFGLGILHTFKLNAPPAWMNVTRSFNFDDFGDLPRVPKGHDRAAAQGCRSLDRRGGRPDIRCPGGWKGRNTDGCALGRILQRRAIERRVRRSARNQELGTRNHETAMTHPSINYSMSKDVRGWNL